MSRNHEKSAARPLANMSAIWVTDDQVEIAVRDIDMQRGDTSGFEAKFTEALRRRPRRLVVELETTQLSTAALGVILRARADAARVGVRFVLRPRSRKVIEMVRGLGVANVLGLAA